MGDFYFRHGNGLLLQKQWYAFFDGEAKSLGLADKHGSTRSPVQRLMAAGADQNFK
jgi:hypothetical protein